MKAADPLSPLAEHPRPRVTLRHALVLLLVVFTVVVMLLTSHQMSVLRSTLPRLSQTMSWLEVGRTPFDLDHVAFFCMLAVAVRMLLPRPRWWRLLLAFAALAIATELLQFGTIGRTPKLLDARDDLIGTGVGLFIGAMTLRCSEYAVRLLRHCWRKRLGASMDSPTEKPNPSDPSALAPGENL